MDSAHREFSKRVREWWRMFYIRQTPDHKLVFAADLVMILLRTDAEMPGINETAEARAEAASYLETLLEKHPGYMAMCARCGSPASRVTGRRGITELCRLLREADPRFREATAVSLEALYEGSAMRQDVEGWAELECTSNYPCKDVTA